MHASIPVNNLKKVMPILKVQNIPLSLTQQCKLLFTTFHRKFTSLKVLTTQYRINVLQSGTPKGQHNTYSKQLIWKRLKKGIIRREPTIKRMCFSLTSKILQFFTTIIPENRHQSKDKIRLVKSTTLTVNSHKNFRNLLLVC